MNFKRFEIVLKGENELNMPNSIGLNMNLAYDKRGEPTNKGSSG